ncbi:MAG: 50S ribosomal protein L10 [Desulfovibrio sp.]|nr:50S ribosomal protein L10 [Desulfovibrio sp.]
MNRSKKAAIIEAVKAKVEKASFAVLTDFKGMTVEELTKLRVGLRSAGGEYHVVKNTLGRIALTGGTHDAIKDKLHENSGVALGYENPMAVAKMLNDFVRQSKLFKIRCASLEGKAMTAEQVDTLARLPGREQLLAQLLDTMNALPTNFVLLFANLICGLLYALNGIEEQKSKSAA